MNDDRDVRTADLPNPRRRVRVAIALLLAALGGAPPPARSLEQQTPASPAPPASTSKDPLDEFVPRERVEADSVVAFPVDI